MRNFLTRTCFLPAFLSAFLVTGDGGDAAAQEPVYPKLTPKLQDLLRREMISLEDASQQILSALVAGDDQRVAALAQQIHDSFILQQEMTPEDRKDLMAAVPEDFVQMDRRFHELSAELARAAEDGNVELQHERFRRMLEACTACHSRYATDRFPKYAD